MISKESNDPYYLAELRIRETFIELIAIERKNNPDSYRATLTHQGVNQTKRPLPQYTNHKNHADA